MFSGIVEEIGHIDAVDAEAGRIRVECDQVLRGSRRGDSIAVNGCCLTIADYTSGGFIADVMPETIGRTTLGSLPARGAVNLEAALRFESRVGGHLLSGHIDGVGTVVGVVRDGNALRVTLSAPGQLLPLLVEKGCVAVDGISLTVVGVEGDRFGVSLVPHTLEHSTSGEWITGSHVNLEGDLVAKYVQRGLDAYVATARPVALAREA
ncbi:MAG: riboflavin synthase [Candidatus Dormibacteraeota bacterium]|nr:riboflavin synthase [Candidatus Dormibacteraeota bacterium]